MNLFSGTLLLIQITPVFFCSLSAQTDSGAQIFLDEAILRASATGILDTPHISAMLQYPPILRYTAFIFDSSSFERRHAIAGIASCMTIQAFGLFYTGVLLFLIYSVTCHLRGILSFDNHHVSISTRHFKPPLGLILTQFLLQ